MGTMVPMVLVDGMAILLSIDTIGIGVGTIGTVSISSIKSTIAIAKTIGTIVGISLGLSICRPLAIVSTIGVGSSISSIAKTGVSSIAKTVSTIAIAKTIRTIESISISLGLGISRPLAIVGTIGIGVGTIGTDSISSIETTIAVSKTVSTIVGISLGLSISRPLSIVSTIGIRSSISVSGIAKTRVSISSIKSTA